MTISRPGRAGLWTLHVAALLVLAFTIVRNIDRPLRWDEIDFARQAHGILLHGAPLLTAAEDRQLAWPPSTGASVRYGMWHPPLYLYTLAGALAIGGDHNWVFRSVGVLSLLLTLLIGWRIAGLTMPAAPTLVRAAPLSLALLSPLVTDFGLLVDIDNTVLAPLLFLLLWTFLRAERPTSLRAILPLAAIFAVALSAKLTTPIIAMGSCGVYALLGDNPVRRAGAVMAASLIGAGVFAFAYWAYCYLLSYPPAFMFEYSYLGKRGMYTSAKSLTAILFAVRWNIVWLGPLMTLLAGLVCGQRLARFMSSRRPQPVDLLWIFALCVFVTYAGVGAMWGKYTMPAAVAAAMAIAATLAPAWSSVGVGHPWTLAAAIAAAAIVHALLPAPQIRPGVFDLDHTSLRSALWDMRNISVAVSCMTWGSAAWLAARYWLTSSSRQVSLALTLTICVVVAAPITTARLAGFGFERGPMRPPQEQGFELTVAYLNRTAPDGAVIVAPKDIGYYYRGRSYGLERLLAEHGAEALSSVGREPNVMYVVDSARYPIVTRPQELAAIGFDHIEHIGDFLVFAKRGFVIR